MYIFTKKKKKNKKKNKKKKKKKFIYRVSRWEQAKIEIKEKEKKMREGGRGGSSFEDMV